MRLQLHSRIVLGLATGTAVGVIAKLTGVAAFPWWANTALPLMEFTGALFIRLITMLVVPLVVASLLVGVSGLGDVRLLGRIGGKTLAYYLTTTAIAVSIGLALAVMVKPGSRIDVDTREVLAAEFREQASARVVQAEEQPGTLDRLLEMVPSNPVSAAAEGNLLPLIIFVVIFGAAVSVIDQGRRESVVSFFEGVNDGAMVVIGWVMRLAPYAVFALIAAVISRFGLDVLRSLALYALVVVAGLAIQVFGTYSTILRVLARLDPRLFLRRVREAQLIAFSTSSSNATLPITMKVAEEKLGVPRPVSSFVLPLGATINMDGTALYQGVATVFIAQVYGVELGLVALATVVLTATLASVGAAGVPSAGLITLILVLESVGLASHAGAGIALILGVDRILDMLRTATNVTGDLACAAIVARSESSLQVPVPMAASATVHEQLA
jgi:Na+/H+-dicarboxylate symporter